MENLAKLTINPENKEELIEKPRKDRYSFTLTPNYEVKVTNFDNFGFRLSLLRGIYGYGFEKPSIIQEKAILPIIKRKDLIVQTYSGSGKTSCYIIGTLHNVDTIINSPQVIVICIAREIAQDVGTVYRMMGGYIDGLKIQYLEGGVKQREEVEILKNGVHVVIGEPLRIYDMLNKGHIKTENLQTVVIDDLDSMSRRKLLEINNCMSFIPSHCALNIFTCSINPIVIDFCKLHLKDPAKIYIPRDI